MIIIVKRSKKSRQLSSQKKQSFLNGSNNVYAYIITALFASLVGTYLDLLFVGIGVYHFPIRLFPEIFTINIGFTLLLLPLFTVFFLLAARRVSSLVRGVVIILISVVVCLIEQLSERLGWFIHGTDWNHAYSFFGYMLFLFIVWKLYRFSQSF
ncbi:CBO0543 family protein [Alteribacillus sp. YIM 98480]|uniref:CBO0543 family protein n=1 Tax=Alteribacillus sp. YIM 98480 TaxID=2606599 RepID=UPI001E63EEAE|nr:CBO0543 family protein [Alteribacillus sp. YIM 98480]